MQAFGVLHDKCTTGTLSADPSKLNHIVKSYNAAEATLTSCLGTSKKKFENGLVSCTTTLAAHGKAVLEPMLKECFALTPSDAFGSSKTGPENYAVTKTEAVKEFFAKFQVPYWEFDSFRAFRHASQTKTIYLFGSTV